jgi:hypothetical protein
MKIRKGIVYSVIGLALIAGGREIYSTITETLHKPELRYAEYCVLGDNVWQIETDLRKDLRKGNPIDCEDIVKLMESKKQIESMDINRINDCERNLGLTSVMIGLGIGSLGVGGGYMLKRK